MPHPNPRILIALAVITALGLGGWYLDQQRERTRSTLSGFFETQPIELSSRVGGRVEKILIREGDQVTAGQQLIIFESRPNRAQAEAQEAQARQAQAKLEQAQRGPRLEEIRRQEAAVAEALANLKKLQNGPRREEIDAARARLRQAEAVLRKARAGPRPQEIDEARAAERAAAAKLAAAERGLTAEEKAQAQARVDAAAAQERLARADLDRAQLLFDDGAISKQQLDRARTDLESAAARRKELAEARDRALAGTPKEELTAVRESYRQARAALDLVLAGTRREDIQATAADASAARANLQLLLRGTRPEEIGAARERVSQAQATLDELLHGTRTEEIEQAQEAAKSASATARASQLTLEERSLGAPRAGVVERVLVAQGDLVQPGETVIRLSDPSDLWIRVYVPETKVGGLRIGDAAELAVDGVSERIPAIVESIATRGEFTPANLQTPTERGKQVFAIRLRLRQPDSRVKPGMFATVKKLKGVVE